MAADGHFYSPACAAAGLPTGASGRLRCLGRYRRFPIESRSFREYLRHVAAAFISIAAALGLLQDDAMAGMLAWTCGHRRRNDVVQGRQFLGHDGALLLCSLTSVGRYSYD